MKAKSLTITLGILLFSRLTTNAQFYTVIPNLREKADETTKGNIGQDEENFFYSYLDSINKLNTSDTKEAQIKSYFTSTAGHEIAIEKDIPVFVNVKDSLLYGLISKRMDICLPLDFISVTSQYGYRKDPFKKCRAFHDGIDLECNKAHVYSMLQGKVTKVVYGKHGYGNYVIVDYGHIQCLYGHLSAITVQEGTEVCAGTILGISGKTGKATGPHLHIKISSHGKRLNPAPFIAYLNKYISGLQYKIAFLRFGTRPNQELNITNLYKVLAQYNVAFPKIVVAQALLETGYFTSNICLNYNNLFGLRKPSDGSYYRFNSWEEAIKAYKYYVQYKYRGGNYFAFLSHIGYAEDPNYLNKVRSICNSL